MEARLRRERNICIHMADSHVAQQKLTEHCKAVILQKKRQKPNQNKQNLSLDVFLCPLADGSRMKCALSVSFAYYKVRFSELSLAWS